MTRVSFLSSPAGAGTRGAPYGAACVASALKAAMPGLVSCSILEAKGGESPEAFARRALADSPDIVGLSVYLWNRGFLAAAAREIKLTNPDLPIIAGGPEASANPEAVLAGGFVDTVIRGEGELAIAELTRAYHAGAHSANTMPRIMEAAMPQLDKLPSPWLDGTLNLADYASAPLELARGCPYRCSFCFESRGRREIRRFPPARAEGELAALSEAGVDEVMVLDPTFNASEAAMASFVDAYSRLKTKPRCALELRAELVNAKQARLLSRVDGFLQLGLQSSNPKALAAVNRSFDAARYSAGIRRLEEEGLTYGLDLIYGLPEDTLASFRASIDYAIGLGPNHLDIFRLSVLPGTDLAERAAGLGLEYQKETPYHVTGTPSFGAADLEKAQLLASAADQMYNRGRAVMWFRALCSLSRMRPSAVLEAWLDYGKGIAVDTPHGPIEDAQVELAKFILARQSTELVEAMGQTIRASGAWTRALADGQGSKLELSYHPEDILDVGCADPRRLIAACRRQPGLWACEPGPEGPAFMLTFKPSAKGLGRHSGR